MAHTARVKYSQCNTLLKAEKCKVAGRLSTADRHRKRAAKPWPQRADTWREAAFPSQAQTAITQIVPGKSPCCSTLLKLNTVRFQKNHANSNQFPQFNDLWSARGHQALRQIRTLYIEYTISSIFSTQKGFERNSFIYNYNRSGETNRSNTPVFSLSLLKE